MRLRGCMRWLPERDKSSDDAMMITDDAMMITDDAMPGVSAAAGELHGWIGWIGWRRPHLITPTPYPACAPEAYAMATYVR